MLSKELVAASTTTLVLSILSEGDSYGYALIRRVQELSAGKIQWSEGMLYPVLHWMEEEGLIESEWRDAETGRRQNIACAQMAGRRSSRQTTVDDRPHHSLKLWKIGSFDLNDAIRHWRMNLQSSPLARRTWTNSNPSS